MKKNIRLTESDLHKIVKTSVKKILKEEHYQQGNVWNVLSELSEVMSYEDILSRLISRIGEEASYKYLMDIKSIEMDAYNDEVLNEGFYQGEYDRTGAPIDDIGYTKSFEYVIDSLINGNFQQVKNLTSKLNKKQRIDLYNYAKEIGYADKLQPYL
jgi:hypothetical protein